MKFLLPQTYQELIERTNLYSHYQKPNAEELLQQAGYQSISLHAQAPIFYVVDYVQRCYLYIDPSCKTVLGYELDSLVKGGPALYTSLWNKADYKVFNEKIFPEGMAFLKKQHPADYPNFSFSFNYRIQNKNGYYLTMLQRSTYFLAAEDGSPLAAVGFTIDISDFKDDTKIIHSIEKIDRHYHTLSKTPILKSVYFPDKCVEVVSNREREVLQLIYEGLSSKEIAEKLFVSINTVNNHRRNMLQKTGTKNANDLIRYAQKHGIL